ncbi:MAG TPA: ATP-binding protein [Solirubrobacterales bacterium]|nr:ATP-binding protein [Solirubrobacterales bacterium]
MNTSIDDRLGLQMSLPARAENVAVVRHALAGLAERLGMDEASLADLKTVVTEACMNVVVHAYAGSEPGPLEVEAESDSGGLTVVIRDHGSGIRPRPDVERPSLRIGLTLIAALSSSFEIRGGADKGTEIRMHVPLIARDDHAPRSPFAVAASEATRIRVGPPEIVGPVLSRALSALVARQDVSVDRLSDTMLLSDAISARAPEGFTDGHVSLSIAELSDGIELKVGPMTQGGAERLRSSFELPEVGGSLEALADDLRVEAGDEGEYLVVAISSSN